MRLDISKSAERVGIPPDSYRRLCRLFIETTEPEIDRLRTAIADQVASEVSRIAHHIAGSAENLEFSRVSEAARAIQAAMATGQTLDELTDWYQELERRFRALQENLREHI